MLVTFLVASVLVFYVFILNEEECETCDDNAMKYIFTDDGNITILLQEDVINFSDVSVYILDWQDNIYINDSINFNIWNFNNSNYFLWTDSNGDSKIGSGDTLEIYNPNGLDFSHCSIKIFKKSTDELVYDSSRIEIG